jgi:hypothetical protein
MAATTAKDLLNDPVPLSVRFDAAVLAQLRASAKRSLRSVTAEINWRVRNSFEQESGEAAAQ